MPIRLPILVATLSLFAALPLAICQETLQHLELSDGWKTASGARLSDDGRRILPTEGESANVLYTNGGADAGFLLSKGEYGDATLALEYLLPEDSDAGLYLVGRYEIKLATGVLSGGFDRDREVSFAPVAPLVDAAKAPDDWQRLEVRFRPLRRDAANNKVEPSFLIEAKLNGELVQQSQPIPYYTEGSLQQWEADSGPYGIRGSNGPVAIRAFSISRADYEAVTVPSEDSPATNVAELVDHVALGKRTFTEFGCIECHTTAKNDASMKTGPNLYGVFQQQPRKRQVQEQSSGNRFLVEADFNYFRNSLRVPATELSVAESGAKTGEAYLPIMAPYSDELISDAKASAIYSYLKTLNDPAQQGPVEALVEKDGPEQYDPMADPMHLLVGDHSRIQRGPMAGLSGRSIHIAQTNGINYSFDPRMLGIGKLWQGGFIDGSGEWKNRGGGALAPGFDNREISIGDSAALVAPLFSDRSPVDFSFKEAVYEDWDTIAASLNSERDHLEMLAEIDAAFLGYAIDSRDPEAVPYFNFRVERNELSMKTEISAEGHVSVELSGSLPSPQKFQVNTLALSELSVSAGSIDANGVWNVPAVKSARAELTARIPVASKSWKPQPSDFSHLRQPLVVEPTDAQLPPGYRSEQFLPPKDNYGRPLLFEATGIDVAPDGTIVVATRTAGIWRIVDGQWRLFAEGIFDSLGVVVEDGKGLQLVIGQKPELTRLTDRNGDEIADTFATLSDQFSYHSNYHSYLHGPARDTEGNYYYNLNHLHTDKAIYKAGGLYMGTSGGFSGWTIKVTPQGDFIPFASGLRSPAGLKFGPDGRLWYTENQGEYVGTSKLFVIEEGGFYGNPVGLVDLPGMQPDSPEIQWPAVADDRERAVVLFPHNLVANAPGNPGWDTTGGKFGPFEGQMFVGDQTQSKLFRVVTESADGVEQGAVIPFGSELRSGIMRPVFLPDGSLIIGQTGRGWQAKGGKIASLQRLVWDGETVAPDILNVSQTSDAFILEFTQPIANGVSKKQLRLAATIHSWMYRDAPDYGSPELNEVNERVKSAELSPDRKSLTLTLEPAKYETHLNQTARVYHVMLNTEDLFPAPSPAKLETWITRYPK